MPNRTLCDVLEEIRKCNDKRNYSYLDALVEEAQHLGNKMEAAIMDKHDIKYYEEERSILKKEYDTLEKEVRRLKLEKEGLGKNENNASD